MSEAHPMKTLEQARAELDRTPPFPRSEYNTALEALIDAKIAAARKPLPPYDGWRVGQDDTPEDTAKGGERDDFAWVDALCAEGKVIPVDIATTCKLIKAVKDLRTFLAATEAFEEGWERRALAAERERDDLEATLAEKDRRIGEWQERAYVAALALDAYRAFIDTYDNDLDGVSRGDLLRAARELDPFDGENMTADVYAVLSDEMKP